MVTSSRLKLFRHHRHEPGWQLDTINHCDIGNYFLYLLKQTWLEQSVTIGCRVRPIRLWLLLQSEDK